MGIKDNIRKRECRNCGTDKLTEKEFIEHSYSDSCDAMPPFEDMFPEYYVCGHGTDADNIQPVYLRIDSETGPIYMAGDSWDYIERPPMDELLRHDWEITMREETPFPEFEET